MRFQRASVMAILAVAIGTLAAAPAFAQKKVKTPRPPRVTKNTPASAPTAGRTALPITFASWLDDASTLARGVSSVSISVGRWSARDGGQTDGPVFDVSAGVSKRVQLGVSVPFYHASYSDGFESSGLGDVYITSKIQVFNPDNHRVGVSVTPLIEVLGDMALSDTTLGLKRVNWALPLSVQGGTENTQAFLTVGYFSRGAIFAGLGVSHTVNERVTLLGSFGVSHSTKDLTATDLAGLSRTRADANAGLSVMLTPRVGFSGSIGRTVSKLDQNGARFMASGAVSVMLGHAKPQH